MTGILHDRRETLGLLAGAAALALPSRALAATREAVIEGAKKEGGLVWYDHYDRDAVDNIFAAFKKAFPFVKNPEFVDVPSAQKTAKVLQESTAGGPTADVLLNDASVQQNLHDRGLLLETDWAALGVATSAVTTPAPHMILALSPFYVILYNTDLAKGADIPGGWDDALDPKWKGRTGHWMRAALFVNLVAALGEDGARDRVNRLAALRPRLFDGLFPLAQAVASGELALAITAYDSAIRIVEKGAPVKMVGLDPTPMGLICGGILKYGRNPNTARLFLSWLASPEGAKVFEDETKRGNFFVPGTETSKRLQGLKLSFHAAEQSIREAKKLNALEVEFSRKLAGR